MIKIYIENLSNEEITKRMKDFCYRIIATVNKENRTSQDVFNMILEVDDWIKALFHFYRMNESEELMLMIEHLELMKACSENIGDSQRTSREKLAIKLKEMEALSLKLLDIIDGQTSKIPANEENKAPKEISEQKINPKADVVQDMLSAEGIDHIKITRLNGQ